MAGLCKPTRAFCQRADNLHTDARHAHCPRARTGTWCTSLSVSPCAWSVCTTCSLPFYRSREARECPGRIGRASPLGTRRWSLLIWTIDLTRATRLDCSSPNAEGGRIQGGAKSPGKRRGKLKREGGRHPERAAPGPKLQESSQQVAAPCYTGQSNHRSAINLGKGKLARNGVRPLPDGRARRGQDHTPFPLPEARDAVLHPRLLS